MWYDVTEEYTEGFKMAKNGIMIFCFKLIMWSIFVLPTVEIVFGSETNGWSTILPRLSRGGVSEPGFGWNIFRISLPKSLIIRQYDRVFRLRASKNILPTKLLRTPRRDYFIGFWRWKFQFLLLYSWNFQQKRQKISRFGASLDTPPRLRLTRVELVTVWHAAFSRLSCAIFWKATAYLQNGASPTEKKAAAQTSLELKRDKIFVPS